MTWSWSFLCQCTVNSGNFQTILALLRAGSDVNGKDQEGDMGLHKSAKIGNDEIVGLKILWARRSSIVMQLFAIF